MINTKRATFGGMPLNYADIIGVDTRDKGYLDIKAGSFTPAYLGPLDLDPEESTHWFALTPGDRPLFGTKESLKGIKAVAA